MFSTKAVNHKINRFHERRLKTLLNDEASKFNGIQSKGNGTNIHAKNIQKMMIDVYNYLYSLSAHIMREVFRKTLKYNIQNPLRNPKTKKYGTNIVAYKASQL